MSVFRRSPNHCLAALLLTLCAAPAAAHPVTVRSCDRLATYDRPPERAVSYDSNLTEMLLALDLSGRMAGYIGSRERVAAAVDLFPKAASLRQIQRQYPTRETLLEAGVDFYFAGWSYGMRAGGEVTPDTLGRLGIPVYELTESCVRIGRREKPTLDFLYRDLLNLGRIFGVEARAEALVAGYRERQAAVAAKVAGVSTRPTVFLYDNEGRVAGTAGAHAMPTALIEAAGGRNIADDVAGNWTRISWESVIERDPDAIVVLDHGAGGATRKLRYALSRSGLKDLRALKAGRVLVLSYDELTPGPRNLIALEKIAEFLHGDR
ncbi:ABC transporter substrate-binding protein [Methylopila musalis]|uniref:ABC transporter substrate-binding protein n=1 Tax=Methylopila musalis TaxID=1134781 RepID=A0ABW3Z7A8_9HYPH